VCAIIHVLAGLQHAHQRNILHRDLKPENILFTRNGLAKLTDWGLARAFGESPRLTPRRHAVGTRHYMAPEQWCGQEAPPADLFSAGKILFELLTGGRHRQDRPVEEELRDFPEELVLICTSALEWDPANRYHSALAMSLELQEFLNCR